MRLNSSSFRPYTFIASTTPLYHTKPSNKEGYLDVHMCVTILIVRHLTAYTRSGGQDRESSRTVMDPAVWKGLECSSSRFMVRLHDLASAT